MSSPTSMYFLPLGNTRMATNPCLALALVYGFWAAFGVKASLLDKEGIEIAKQILGAAPGPTGRINLFDTPRLTVIQVRLNTFLGKPTLNSIKRITNFDVIKMHSLQPSS